MATNTRKLSDFLAEGSGDTFGDLPVENPHIKPEVLYPAWSGLLTDNSGAYTFTDSGNQSFSLETFGGVHHTGTEKKIGSTSMRFDGVDDYIRIADASDHLTFGTGDVTIEFWYKTGLTSSTDEANRIITRGRHSEGEWFFRTKTSASQFFKGKFGSTNISLTYSGTDVFADAGWHHIAVVRASTTVKLYIDGTERDSATVGSDSWAVYDTNYVYLGVGVDAGPAEWAMGYLDDLRITKGLAVYTGNFTPQTTALTTTWSAGTNIAANSDATKIKLLIHSDNGGHVGAYGTAQADGLKYYYTDIKGSKPIKDPRIGAHFGSQRHTFNSLQLLEQETATHGDEVFSIDGREWIRAVGDQWVVHNTAYGNALEQLGSGMATDSHYIEIVGYFNDANFLHYFYSSTINDHQRVSINGGTVQATNVDVSAVTPLGSARFVDPHSLTNLIFNSTPTLGINTLKIATTNGHYLCAGGIELITQDTTSTATKSQIQIPSQNVVSFGKKFTVAETKHYNPFAFKTDGSTAWASGAHNGTAWPIGTGSSTNIDTATSLGLTAWVSTNYYYPYNGGRVVKWIASDGTIKTSVNMMPPNARSVGNSASLTNGTAKANASIANNTFYPTMEAGAIDHSQAEVAKTFHWRQFGNGSANGGTSHAYWADASMLKTGTDDNVAYVMDDGLTTLSADTIEGDGDELSFRFNGNTSFYIIFIGTGISIEKKVLDTQAGSDSFSYMLDGVTLTTYSSSNAAHPKFINLAQNLPYGTHILKVSRAALSNVHPYWREFTFHQPKMPPIPENAVVIADYMLMADYVKQTDCEPSEISKGVRYCSGSRDHFGNATAAFYTTAAVLVPFVSQYGVTGGSTPYPGGQTGSWKLPFFGTTGQSLMESSHVAGHTVALGGATATETALDSSGGGDFDQITISGNTNGDVTLGMTNIETTLATGSHRFWGHHLVSPIHTSSHYQTFETPFLHELVGGDRNMEQTNLVVTSDGKTWDEVTRDTSYIGNTVVFVRDHEGWNSDKDWSIQRGRGPGTNKSNMVFKDSWVNAYDRFICLRTGYYTVFATVLIKEATHFSFYVNGTNNYLAHSPNTTTNGIHAMAPFQFSHYFERGDYMNTYGQRYGDTWSYVSIVKQDEVE